MKTQLENFTFSVDTLSNQAEAKSTGRKIEVFMRKQSFWVVLLLAALTSSVAAEPIGTGFTYQGELKVQGLSANGSFDFKFELYDVEANGTPVTDPLSKDGVTVSDGIFSVELDYGSGPFVPRKQLWLQIAVKNGGDIGEYSTLTPRQKLTASPFALASLDEQDPKEPYAPKVFTIDCDSSPSESPIQDILNSLNPVRDVYIIKVIGSCDGILSINGFFNITIESLIGVPNVGRVEVNDSSYVSIRNIDLIGPYTIPSERGAIVLDSAGEMTVNNVSITCPVPSGHETGDCVDALWIKGPGKLTLSNVDIIGNWKVGIQTRENANVLMEGGSIAAAAVHIGLRDQSYMRLSGTVFTPDLVIHAFEHSHLDSSVPVDSSLVISSLVVGMKADGTATCMGAFPAALVGGTLDNGINLCSP